MKRMFLESASLTPTVGTADNPIPLWSTPKPGTEKKKQKRKKKPKTFGKNKRKKGGK